MTGQANRGLWTRRLSTAILSLLGVAVLWYFQFPLPFLIGPLAICLVSALMGSQLAGPPTSWLNAVRTTLGVAAGSSMSPSLIQELPDTIASASMVPLFLVASLLLGYPYFRYIAGFDRTTAYFATMPGGFAEMILFGGEKGGNIRVLSLVHATRLLTIVSVTPFILGFYLDVDLNVAPGVRMQNIPINDLVIMGICAVVGLKLARRIGMFGAPILGPMILAGAASLTGLIENRPPTEVLILAQFIIGTSIGAHYVNVTTDELRRVISASVGYVVILGLLTFGFGAIVYALGVSDLLNGILAFAPGGQPEMVMLAILTGADVTFVIFHHVLRLLIVLSLTPVLARWLA